MRRLHPFRSLCLLLFLSTCGDVVYEEPFGPPIAVVRGNLVLEWSINGAIDPALCNQVQATTLEIEVTPVNGLPGLYSQYCDYFATNISLPPGLYYARAWLLDPWGNARTTYVTLERFRIFGNDRLTIPIDFPPSSFY